MGALCGKTGHAQSINASADDVHFVCLLYFICLLEGEGQEGEYVHAVLVALCVRVRGAGANLNTVKRIVTLHWNHRIVTLQWNQTNLHIYIYLSKK